MYNPYYDICRQINSILPGYSAVARMYVGSAYQCYGTIIIFIIMSIFLRYLVKLGLEMSYGRISLASSNTLNGLSWALGFAIAFGLGRFVVIILNPIIAIILFIILLIVFVRLARK